MAAILFRGRWFNWVEWATTSWRMSKWRQKYMYNLTYLVSKLIIQEWQSHHWRNSRLRNPLVFVWGFRLDMVVHYRSSLEGINVMVYAKKLVKMTICHHNSNAMEIFCSLSYSNDVTYITLTHCGLMSPYNFVNIGPRNCTLPVGNKPLFFNQYW